jgi:hypothetical protein
MFRSQGTPVMRTGILVVVFVAIFTSPFVFVGPALADKNATMEPKLATPTDSGAVQDFDSEISKPLTAVKGEWQVVDGVLLGKELESDAHAAVLNYQQKNRNSIVRFSFKVEGSTKGFNFSLNHSKGHLFRVTVAPTAMTISLDKDKKDASSKVIKLATAKGKFEQGVWYTMQVEMKGDKVVAQTDNGICLEASHVSLDTDKPGYRFVMKGDSLSIDDLHVTKLK